VAYAHYEGEDCSQRAADKLAAEIEKLVLAERERCAQIAESEPWPEGPAPSMVILASAGLSYEKVVEATVKATRDSIAKKIRQQDPNQKETPK
jgi:hypothetical protein